MKAEFRGRDLKKTMKTPFLGVLTMLAYVVVFIIALGALVVLAKLLSILFMG